MLENFVMNVENIILNIVYQFICIIMKNIIQNRDFIEDVTLWRDKF